MQDFEQIRSRFITIQKTLQLTDAALGMLCGISHTSVNNIKNGKSNGFDVSIVANLQKNANVNPQWLIGGTGEMFNDEEKNLLKEDQGNYRKLEKFKEKIIKEKKDYSKEEIKLLDELVNTNTELAKFLNKYIELSLEHNTVLKECMEQLKLIHALKEKIKELEGKK